MKFLKAFLLFIRMYRDGFFFSDSTRVDPDGTRWGFYRFNHNDRHAMFDVDFSFIKNRHSYYFHVHGNDSRVEYNLNNLDTTIIMKKHIENDKK